MSAQDQPTSVLILSAGVGRGHHAAAEGLREELRSSVPEVRVTVLNGIGGSRGAVRVLLERYLRWQLMYWPRAYSLSYAICVRWRPGRSVVMRMLHCSVRRRLGALIELESPDVVVSTYPGVTAALGIMRQRKQLDVPVCALITDIAGLHFWAHAHVDLHLACYHESLSEIAEITGGAPARATSAPLAAAHRRIRDRHAARVALGLDPNASVILVSGGGWGVGDLHGAISAALETRGAQVIAVCGQNNRAQRYLSSSYANEQRVRVLGYTKSMADLLGAASVLVHSTGGMTCLEAAAQGCPVIAYGFGFGHMRQNVAAMARCELIEQAHDRPELTHKLREALASSAVPPRSSVVERESASSVVLDLLERGPLAPSTSAFLPAGLADTVSDTAAASL